jgi:hypothetical protein
MRRRGIRPGSRLAAALAAVTCVAATALTGCGSAGGTVPSCGDPLKLAIIAQSVSGASYVPCIGELPEGWSTSGFDPASGGTSFTLDSDRSPGRPVTVRLSARCATGGASPSPPRAPGVLSYTRLTSISPRFAGTLYDVFPGGCVSYQFDFTLGEHIALMEQFQSAVGLYPVQQLRLVVKQKLGVELSP